MYRFIIIKKRTAICILITTVLMLATTIIISAMGLAAEDEKEEPKVRLPILMYHSILQNPSSAGKYVVSPGTFENDIKYLKDNGYTSILSDELIAYVKNGEPLPSKPVMITLDDGYLNNLTYALPILEKYDMKAIISVVGKYTERFSAEDDHNPSYSHFSWEDINTCIASGRIEIGNHSYDMHSQGARKGTTKKRGESETEYEKVLSEDVLKMQALLLEHCNAQPKVFTYPYGAVSNASVDIIKKLGFEVSFGCCEKVNEISRNENALYLLCRFNRPSGISTEKFMKKITE
ncbi:MAG: polysaccharide deacetylase family protein [Ruminococcaceae bacterium]|nr:polysaccharide deacetylase family protein [Oscillospiraceae bacterium]